MTTRQYTESGQVNHESSAPWEEWEESPLPVRSDRVTTDVGARLPRQTLKETRADLLKAAVRIVNEFVRTDQPRDGDPPVDLLPFVRLEEVLEAATELSRQRLVSEGRLKAHEQVAPLTAGAFYKAFVDEHRGGGRGAALTSFHRLVTRKMVDDELVTDAERYIGLGTRLLELGEPWQETARQAIKIEYGRWSATPALVLFSALALYTREKDVQEWTRKVNEEELKQLTRIYEVLLKVYGLKLRPGITLEHLAVAVSDLITGMAVNSRFVPETRNITIDVDVDGRGKRPWHLCALTAWAIYNSFLEPSS